STAGAAMHPGARLERAPVEPPNRTRGRPRVLFLCTGNSARSQMAEPLLEERSRGAFGARSAGSRSKPLHPNAVRVMADPAIDLPGPRTNPPDRFSNPRFDAVISDQQPDTLPDLVCSAPPPK